MISPFAPWSRFRNALGSHIKSTSGRTLGIILLSVAVLGSVGDSRSIGDWQRRGGIGIVVHKGRQVLELYLNGSKVRTYRVCLGLDPEGPKRVTGDRRTPEGNYVVCYKSQASRFHRFLGISYPSEDDVQMAFERGLISLDKRDTIIDRIRTGPRPPWNTELGGWVGIHGYPTDENHRRWVSLLYPKPHNWTDGCIAMWNFEVEELFSIVPLGTPITIVP